MRVRQSYETLGAPSAPHRNLLARIEPLEIGGERRQSFLGPFLWDDDEGVLSQQRLCVANECELAGVLGEGADRHIRPEGSACLAADAPIIDDNESVSVGAQAAPRRRVFEPLPVIAPLRGVLLRRPLRSPSAKRDPR